MRIKPRVILGSTALLAVTVKTYAVTPTYNQTCTTSKVIANKYKTAELNTMLQCTYYFEFYVREYVILHVIKTCTQQFTHYYHISSNSTGSDLVYDFSTVRKIVTRNDSTLNPGKKNTVAFENPGLVVTQHSDTRKNPFEGTFLKYPVTVHDFQKFVKSNQKYLVDDDGNVGFNEDGDGKIDITGDGNSDVTIVKRMEQVDDEFPGLEFVEFDDEFRKSELVYSVIINKAEKRVTVVFRGSVTPMDLIMDASIYKKTPEKVKEFCSRLVNLHGGFSSEYISTPLAPAISLITWRIDNMLILDSF